LGLQVVIMSTLNGIAIACDTSPSKMGENNSNIFKLNAKVAVAVHESLDAGSRFIARLREANLPENMDHVIVRASELFNTFVTEDENKQHVLGVIFAGYNLQGKPIIRAFRYDGPQTQLPVKLRKFHPYVVSTIPSPLYRFLHDRTFTHDMSIEEALDLAAFWITQSRIIFRTIPLEDWVCLAKILPDDGFIWVSDEETKTILKKNHKRSLKIRKECVHMFWEGETK
jgi:hypothetical protein